MKDLVISEARAVAATRLWVQRVVIGLSLCPWARQSTIRYAFSSEACPGGEAELLACVAKEVNLLRHSSREPEPRGSNVPETTILVCPHAFPGDFAEFYGLVQEAEEQLVVDGLDDDFQVVGFHPQYQFAGEGAYVLAAFFESRC